LLNSISMLLGFVLTEAFFSVEREETDRNRVLIQGSLAERG